MCYFFQKTLNTLNCRTKKGIKTEQNHHWK